MSDSDDTDTAEIAGIVDDMLAEIEDRLAALPTELRGAVIDRFGELITQRLATKLDEWRRQMQDDEIPDGT